MNNKYDLLNSTGKYITRLKDGILKCSKHFQSGQINEGAESVLSIIEGLQWLIDAVTLTVDIQKEPIYSSEINEMLNEIVKAFQNEDYILVGDLFEYEIIPVLNKWDKIINISLAN
jgi:hypothetical protein